MGQPSVCYCTDSAEAVNISKYGDSHVNCPCPKCKGRATWRMTAWRHLNRERKHLNEESTSTTENSLAKKHRVDIEEEEPEEGGNLEVNDQSSIVGFVSDLELGVGDPSLCNASPSSPDPADDLGDSSDNKDDVSPVELVSQNLEHLNADSEEMVKEFVEDAVLRLLELKENICCSEKHFEDLLKWGKSLHTSGNQGAGEYWPNNWNDVQIILKKHWFCFTEAVLDLFKARASKSLWSNGVTI